MNYEIIFYKLKSSPNLITPIMIDKIQGATLVELAAKIPLVIAVLMRDECEAEIEKIKKEVTDDDIPF